MFAFGKRNRRVVNSNGEILCTKCGYFRKPEEYYNKKSECSYCSKNRSNNNLAQRVRDAKRAQEAGAGYLDPKLDNLTEQDILELLVEQDNMCPACGEIFHCFSDFEIAHIVSIENGGHLNKDNIQLVCHKHNARGRAGTKNILYMRVTMKSRINVNVRWE